MFGRQAQAFKTIKLFLNYSNSNFLGKSSKLTNAGFICKHYHDEENVSCRNHSFLVGHCRAYFHPKVNGKTLLGTRMMPTSGLVMTDKNPSSLQHPIQCRPLQNQNPVGNTKPKSVRTMCEKKLFLHPLFSFTSLPNESLACG